MSKEEYARKRIHNGCLVQIESPSPRITVRHHSESLAMLNSYRCDRIFNPQLTAIKILIIKKMCKVRTFVTHEYEIFFFFFFFFFFVHTYVTYEKCNLAEPMLHTKYDN